MDEKKYCGILLCQRIRCLAGPLGTYTELLFELAPYCTRVLSYCRQLVC